jgi:ankyrin repeat protein
VLLEFVDHPNLLDGNEDTSITPLIHYLAYMAAPTDISTHVNQLILAKQLIEHGGNFNAVSIPDGNTLLHMACHGFVVTNLDVFEYLLERGADPNVQDRVGRTPWHVCRQ